MTQILQTLFLLSLSLWVGGMIFFSTFVTPLVFKQLPKEIASQLMSSLFPPYYILGYCSGILLFLSSIGESILLKKLLWIKILLVLVMMGCTVYAGIAILPKTHVLKQELKTFEEQSELALQKSRQFQHYHRQAVFLNAITMLIGLALLVLFALRLKI